MNFPELEIKATHYLPEAAPTEISPVISELEANAMRIALSEAGEALIDGNPPIGAVIINNASGALWAAKTADKTNRHLADHAEMRVYDLAQPTVGDELQDTTLVSTAQLCATCSPFYAGGKIGRVILGAKREDIYPLAGIMRSRSINMPELFEDGNTDTVVVENLMAIESLKLFAQYGRLKQHELPEGTQKYLVDISESI